MSAYDSFAPIYDEWSAHMTEDVPFYVELAREADGPIVELAVGTGRVALPVARATGRNGDRDRRVAGDARAGAVARRAAGVELDLREGDMRELELDEPAALVYCPFRSLLHLPTWADRRRVFERVAASLRPGGRFAWNAFVFDPDRGRHDGSPTRRTASAAGPPRAARQPDRHHARERRHDLALVGDGRSGTA